jgi:oligoribonuclease NrnB/cAMP/cGMP phosphodiesterase (DHH superfamily)
MDAQPMPKDDRPISTKPLCIWHKGCLDGFTSAWVVDRFFQGEVEYFGGVYQEPPPDVTDRNVLMVDFSYKKEVIEEMRKTARAILILDHHKTAEADLQDYIVRADKVKAFPYFPPVGECAAFFDMNRSGAALCWDFFNPGQPMPRFVQHVQDRDLWRFAIPGTREINTLAYSQAFDFDMWDEMVKTCETGDGQRNMIIQGLGLERQQAKHVESMIANGVQFIVLGGIKMPVVNAPNFLASDIGNRLSQTYGFKCGATYIDMEDKRAWSMRSIDGGPDVSEIAKAMGGGGHAHAAGFTTPQDWKGDHDEGTRAPDQAGAAPDGAGAEAAADTKAE